MSIGNGPPGNVRVVLQGQSEGDGSGNITITSSHITLASSTSQERYAGTLSSIYGGRRWSMAALLMTTGAKSGSKLQVRMMVQVDVNGRATGTITAGSANPAGNSV